MATSYGYQIYVLRARTRWARDNTLLQLNALGDGADLLHGIHGALRELEGSTKPAVNERRGRALNVLSAEPAGRCVTFEAESGAFGDQGSNMNVDTGRRRKYSERDANLTAKRGMVVIPEDAVEGLLFVERRGGATFRDHFDESVLRAVRNFYGITVSVDALIDQEAWAEFITESDSAELHSVWRPRTTEESVAGVRTTNQGHLKMTLTGARAAIAYRDMRDRILGRIRGGSPDALEIRTPASLRPADEDDFEQERLEVKIDSNGQSRTVHIEREQLPGFNYALDGYMETDELTKLWHNEVIRIAPIYGWTVGGRWKSAQWSEEAINVRVPVLP